MMGDCSTRSLHECSTPSKGEPTTQATPSVDDGLVNNRNSSSNLLQHDSVGPLFGTMSEQLTASEVTTPGTSPGVPVSGVRASVQEQITSSKVNVSSPTMLQGLGSESQFQLGVAGVRGATGSLPTLSNQGGYGSSQSFQTGVSDSFLHSMHYNGQEHLSVAVSKGYGLDGKVIPLHVHPENGRQDMGMAAPSQTSPMMKVSSSQMTTRNLSDEDIFQLESMAPNLQQNPTAGSERGSFAQREQAQDLPQHQQQSATLLHQKENSSTGTTGMPPTVTDSRTIIVSGIDPAIPDTLLTEYFEVRLLPT